jgi:hypothetical protein
MISCSVLLFIEMLRLSLHLPLAAHRSTRFYTSSPHEHFFSHRHINPHENVKDLLEWQFFCSYKYHSFFSISSLLLSQMVRLLLWGPECIPCFAVATVQCLWGPQNEQNAAANMRAFLKNMYLCTRLICQIRAILSAATAESVVHMYG